MGTSGHLPNSILAVLSGQSALLEQCCIVDLFPSEYAVHLSPFRVQWIIFLHLDEKKNEQKSKMLKH